MSETPDEVRRRRASDLDLPEGMIEALVALEPRCDWPGHEACAHGCHAAEAGSYVIRVRPHCISAERAGAPPMILVICESQQIRQRNRSGEAYRCECGQTYVWASVVDFLGRVADYYPSRAS